MTIENLFFEASVVSTVFWCWFAFAVASFRLLAKDKKNIGSYLVLSAVLGPILFLVATIWVKPKRNIDAKQKKFLSFPKTVLAIIAGTVLISVPFYFLFVQRSLFGQINNISIDYVIYYLLFISFFTGALLSFITRRVSFFESIWVVFLLSSLSLVLSSWADEYFSYGTSFAYFIALLFGTLFLMLVSMTLGGSLGFLIFGNGFLNLSAKFETFIGFRFLMAKRTSGAVSIITLISIVAVTVASMGMIIVLSVMNGFTDDIKSKILGANPHLMVMKYGDDFSEYDHILKKTKDINGVKGAWPFILKVGMVQSKRNLNPAIVTGIDIDTIENGHDFNKYVSKESIYLLKNPADIKISKEIFNGSLGEENSAHKQEKNLLPSIILGREMANDLQVFVGDMVSIVSPNGELGPTGIMPSAKAFRVAGFFNSGFYEFDAKFAYISLHEAQSFYSMSGLVSGIEFKLLDIENTKIIGKEIEQKIGSYPYYVRDWIQMNRPMFSALQLEKIAMLIILTTLIFMSSLLILTTLIMVVMEKEKEIAILKSMGSYDTSIMKIFITYGLVVGSIGAFLGGFLGVTIAKIIEKVGIKLDPDIYYISSLPIKIIPSEVLLIVISTIIISFLATIPPALYAARQKVVEGLRYI